MEEARARDLLGVPLAWPLSRRLDQRQRFSRARLSLFDRLARKDHFAFFAPHNFEPDRLSESVVERSAFEQTYARPVRPRTDQELPSEVLDALANHHVPQFTLRNIGRYEKPVDLEDPLPFERQRGLGGNLGAELRAVRSARIPRPEMAQIWTVAFVGRVRNSLRRIVLEDPWSLRYGQEVSTDFDGVARNFVVEGTHPDDLPGAPWGPDLIDLPAKWLDPPPGEKAMERPYDPYAFARAADDGSGPGRAG